MGNYADLARTRQVMAVELQAHGHTPDIDRPLSFEQDADDVAALLTHLAISKADIMGFSNGGMPPGFFDGFDHARLAILPGGHGDYIGEICSPDKNGPVPKLVTAMIDAFLCLLILFLPFAGLRAQSRGPVKLAALPRPMYWENTPVHFEATGGRLVIEAGEKTDMFRDPNVTYNNDNAPKLLFVADSNFVLTAAIHHAFASKWDGGAIVLKADSLNWIKFCFEKDYTGHDRVVSVVTKGISDDCNSAASTANTIYYKIAKAGNVITLYFSPEGKSWYLIRHLVFDSSGPLKLGFLAQSPTGKNCRVTFSDIHYSTKKIGDPYLGE